MYATFFVDFVIALPQVANGGLLGAYSAKIVGWIDCSLVRTEYRFPDILALVCFFV